MHIGIDVSNHQPNFDWDAAQANHVTWAYCKVSEGVYFTDNQWLRNVVACHDRGIPIGGYHYARPDRQEPKNEADFYMSRLGDKFQIRPVLDVESHSLSPIATTDWILSWADRIDQRLGIKPIIYTYTSFIRSAIAPNPELNQYPLIQADYKWDSPDGRYLGPQPAPNEITIRPPHSWTKASGWQFTSKYRIGGWNGNLDYNIGDVATLRTSGAIQPPTEDQLAQRPDIIYYADPNEPGGYSPNYTTDWIRYRTIIEPIDAEKLLGPDWLNKRVEVSATFGKSLKPGGGRW